MVVSINQKDLLGATLGHRTVEFNHFRGAHAAPHSAIVDGMAA
ncbi:hypothetical protein [Bradyrhizobium sp. Arg816]|nr:hypothetical protein [Bradyrhizobium sp. Arg816]MDI3563771.1 hypothetical protein [Bradyrhizobium sp. Arg816]